MRSLLPVNRIDPVSAGKQCPASIQRLSLVYHRRLARCGHIGNGLSCGPRRARRNVVRVNTGVQIDRIPWLKHGIRFAYRSPMAALQPGIVVVSVGRNMILSAMCQGCNEKKKKYCCISNVDMHTSLSRPTAKFDGTITLGFGV